MSFTIPLAFRDPIEAFAPFADRPWAMLLDSASADPRRGRHVFLAIEPYKTLLDPPDPFGALESALGPRRAPAFGTSLPFTGGAVGLFGYELGRHLERAPARHVEGGVEMAVGIYDVIAGFDLQERRAWVVGTDRAKAERIAAIIEAAPALAAPAPAPALECRPELSQKEYLERVEKVIAYIAAGDIFQANFTQRFLAGRPDFYSAFELYR
ncbi:MAG TPA: aminodeoxychorismate/anthranilate synthase component I, partial [Magnetospirillaceae bacterium]|nr:aminodeoxychorismate/anthranilate synthase component I [Magnetospirillaceae bacterium]